jgi:hypothetical protein
VVDIKADSRFMSRFRAKNPEILHERNNWICYDFRDRRVILTHYEIRSDFSKGVDNKNLKSWIVEVSEDGEEWSEVDEREDNSDVNETDVTGLFSVARKEVGRFVRLVNIGRDHSEDDCLCISAWEVFGTLLE